MKTDPEKTDVRDETPEPEVDSTPANAAERSVDEELEDILAEFRKEASPKPETDDKDVSLEDRLKRVEQRDKQRAEGDYQKDLRNRLDETVDELMKAAPELGKITKAGVRGNLIGDLYEDAALVAAFSDRSNPKAFKKIVGSLAKRYAAALPEDAPNVRDDTDAVLAEVRGVSTRPPKAPDETEFARTASSTDFWTKYGGAFSGAG